MGSSIPVYMALKNKLSFDNSQNFAAFNISSNNNPFDTDINIMFSNKFLNIVITNANKKIDLIRCVFVYGIGIVVGFVSGSLMSLIYRHFLI